jgi:O-antigen ligase
MFIFIFVPWLQGRQPFFKSKTITYIFLAFSVVGLLIAYSMTGVVGLVLVVGGYFLLERVKNYSKIWKIVIFAVIVIFITDFAVKSYTQISIVELFEKRITGIFEWGSETAIATPGESFGVRLESGGKSFEIWKENPIFGVGLGLTFYQGKDIEFGDFGFLAAMAEMGLFGFFSFVGMFAFLLFITAYFIKNPQKLSFLDEEQKRIAGMSFYIMLLLFEINFITGNNLVTIGLWMPIAMIFFIINTYYVKKGINVKEFYMVTVPLKEKLGMNLSRYLNYKMKNNRSSIED